jgi:uncharacterized membrane protein YeaQ/YmgE (transglycosylase-associated protein family)
MSILGWIVLGLIAGFIGSKIVNRQGQGFFLDIILGVVGAVVGGFLFAQFGAAGVTGLNLYSMLVAVVGSIVVLVLYHAIFGAAPRVDPEPIGSYGRADRGETAWQADPRRDR